VNWVEKEIKGPETGFYRHRYVIIIKYYTVVVALLENIYENNQPYRQQE
jgi:hypothetical protein